MKNAINNAISREFRERVRVVKNPYGDGNTSSKVVNIIWEWMIEKNLDIKKKFFDIDYEQRETTYE